MSKCFLPIGVPEIYFAGIDPHKRWIPIRPTSGGIKIETIYKRWFAVEKHRGNSTDG